jgi:hypothetical protein
MRFMACPDYTVKDARERWRGPRDEQVDRACPWCASYLFPSDEKLSGQTEIFDQVVECRNLVCPMVSGSGKCYWEPYPDGWTVENKGKWLTKTHSHN